MPETHRDGREKGALAQPEVPGRAFRQKGTLCLAAEGHTGPRLAGRRGRRDGACLCWGRGSTDRAGPLAPGAECPGPVRWVSAL